MPSPYTMPSQSGMDIQLVISKLIEAERAPLKRLEEDNKRNEIRIQAWEELQTRAKKLSDLSRDIYSYTGPFATKTLISSDESSISGTVSFSAKLNEIQQNVEVLQLATYHKIRSREIQSSEILPSGKFSIRIDGNQIDFDFKGGNVEQLFRLLQNESGKFYDVHKVNISSDSSILILQSKISGAKGKIELSESDQLLKTIEVVGNIGKPYEKSEKVHLVKENFIVSEGSIENIQINRQGWVSQGPMRYRYNFNFNIEEKIKQIAFFYSIKNIQTKVTRNPEREKIIMGPTIKDKIFDIEIYGPHIEQEREIPLQEEEKKESFLKITVHWESYGTSKSKEFFLKNSKQFQIQLQDLNEKEPIQLISMEIEQNFEGELKIENLNVVKVIPENTVYAPLHEIDPPQNAKLKINGIEVQRNTNENITDLIQGVSLNLHKPTQGQVTLKIQSNVGQIKEKIKNWVTAYNELMTFIKDNDKFNREQDFLLKRSSDPRERIEDGFRKLEDESGIFAGEPIARRLVSILSSIVGNSYPVRIPPKYRMLTEIGISTGKIGSDWKDIKKGLLILDEEKLEQSLIQYPDAVKEIFAMDRNEDSLIDDGVAFKMNQELSPYVQVSGGIITSRVNLLKEKIKENKKIILNKELSLMRKEEMLRQKFGRMESSIRNSRETGNILKNRLGIKDE